MALLRIIGGQWRRRQWPVPDRPGLRPTPDRVRETLFNWLGQDLAGRHVLDLFAGAGGLGFEAGSRGAEVVWMIERDARAAAALESVRTMLGPQAQRTVRIVRADAIAWLRAGPLAGGATPQPPAGAGGFDLALLDPPFGSGLDREALRLLPAWLAADAHVYVECAQPLDPADAGPAFTMQRSGRAGAVHYHLLRFDGPAQTPGPAHLPETSR